MVSMVRLAADPCVGALNNSVYDCSLQPFLTTFSGARQVIQHRGRFLCVVTTVLCSGWWLRDTNRSDTGWSDKDSECLTVRMGDSDGPSGL